MKPTTEQVLAQGEQEIESDRPHVENDGCPTEKAVLQRFWREHQTQGEPKQQWRSLTSAQTKVLWNLTKKPTEYAAMIDAKLRELNG